MSLADGAHRITSDTNYLLNGTTLKSAGESVVLNSITSISSAYATAAPTTASYVTTTSAGDGYNRAIATDGDTVITTDDGQLYYSTNNVSSWGTASLPNRQYADWCAYGNGKFIALGTRSGNYITIWYSTDGINWTQGTLNQIYRTGGMYGIVPHPGGFVAACNSGVFTSTDGITWTWTAGFTIGSPVYEPTSKMFFGYNVSSTSYIVYSTNGINWQLTNDSAGTTIRSCAVIPGRVYFFYYSGSKYYETENFATGTLQNGPNIGQTTEQASFFDGIDSSFICTTDTPKEINRLNPDGSITTFQQGGYISAMAWNPAGGKFWVSENSSIKDSQSAQIAVSTLVETLSTEVISTD